MSCCETPKNRGIGEMSLGCKAPGCMCATFQISKTKKKDKKGKKKRRKNNELPSPPETNVTYEPCVHLHFKTDMVDRDCLTHEQYLDLLATPKGYRWIGEVDCNNPELNVNKVKRKKPKKAKKVEPEVVKSDVGEYFADEFVEDMWDVMSPDITNRLIDFLVNEFGMSVEECEDFIDCKSAAGKQTICKKKKSKALIGLGPSHKWVKEFSDVFAKRIEQYIASMLLMKRTPRVKRIAERILDYLCDLTGVKTTLQNPKTKIQRTMVLIADRMALWIEDLMKDIDKPSKKLAITEEEEEEEGEEEEEEEEEKKEEEKEPEEKAPIQEEPAEEKKEALKEEEKEPTEEAPETEAEKAPEAEEEDKPEPEPAEEAPPAPEEKPEEPTPAEEPPKEEASPPKEEDPPKEEEPTKEEPSAQPEEEKPEEAAQPTAAEVEEDKPPEEEQVAFEKLEGEKVEAEEEQPEAEAEEGEEEGEEEGKEEGEEEGEAEEEEVEEVPEEPEEKEEEIVKEPEKKPIGDIYDLVKEDIEGIKKDKMTDRQRAVKGVVDKRLEKILAGRDFTDEDIDDAASRVAHWIEYVVGATEPGKGAIPRKSPGPAFQVKPKSGSTLEIHKLSSGTVAQEAAQAKGLPPPPRERKIPTSESPMNVKSTQEWVDWATNIATVADEWGKWLDSTLSDAEKQLAEKKKETPGTDWKQWRNQAEIEARKWRVEKERIKGEGTIWDKKIDEKLKHQSETEVKLTELEA